MSKFYSFYLFKGIFRSKLAHKNSDPLFVFHIVFYLPFLDIMPDMQKNKKLKPWLTNKIDLEKEMKQLGIKKKDLRLDDTDQPVVLDVVNNPIDRVILQYLIISNNL